MDEIKLSILIPTTPEREPFLKRLMEKLNAQTTPEVEVLIELDNGGLTTGMKRNILIARARGEYVCFVDDDDLIHDDYVKLVLKAIETKPDVVGMRGIYIVDGDIDTKTLFEHSIRHQSWFTRAGIACRCPNHLNPVKRELAAKAEFPDLTFQEDFAYSMALKPLLETEVMIEEPIYLYEYRNRKEEQPCPPARLKSGSSSQAPTPSGATPR